MPDAGIGDKTDLVKSLKNARDQLLKEWDISFGINGEILSNIMSFISDITTDVLIKFYKDKIFSQLKSPDNIQYAEIEIGSADVLDYNPNIDGDPSRRDIKSVIKGSEGDFKGILVDMRGINEEMSPYAQKDDLINVRIDSCYYKRIEFHCPGNIIIWAQLMDPTATLKAVERLPDIITGVRNNPNIRKASVIIEPSTFARICAIGGKAGKKRDIDERIFIQLDKKGGLYITSGDKLKGRMFELKPVEVEMEMDIDMGEGEGEGMAGIPGEGFPGEMNRSSTFEGIEEEMSRGIDDTGFDYAPGRDEKKKVDKKKSDKAPLDQLLGMDVDTTQYIYLGKDFILPFIKLKGLSPIEIEIRTDKPIFIQQKPYNGIRAMLTIAPRIENEEDK